MVRGAALALRTGAVIAFSVALAVLLSVVLANLNFERTLREVTGSRFAVVGDDVRRQVELGLTLGLDLTELADVQALADRAAAGAGILGVEVVDERGTILFAADRATIGRPSSNAWTAETDAGPVRRRIEGDTLILGADLRNSFGQVVGSVVMRASVAELRARIETVRHGLAGGTLALVAAAGLGALAAVFATLRLGGARAPEGADGVRPLVMRLTVVTVAVLLLAAGGASWLTLSRFDAVLQPELARKSEMVGTQLAAQVDRALGYGIPLDRMPGLDTLLREEAARHADVAYLAVGDPQGRILASAGPASAAGLPAAGFIDTALPLSAGPLEAGSLHIGVDAAYLAKASTGLMLDVLSVVLVAVLLIFEVLLLVVHRSMGRALAQRPPDAVQERPFNLVYLRLPVFLFCLSEELSRPFLPAYSQSFAAAVPWLTPDIVVGLPITLFMLIWAMSQPGGARVSERWGRGRAFLAGALLGSASLAMTADAGSLGELLLWRCLTALGYGLVLITAQGIVVDHTTLKNRAGGMALYIGALLAAGVCGPVTGGIIADQVGIEATFLVGSALALGSGLTLTALLRRAGVPAAAARMPLGAGRPLLRNLRFMGLMLFSAIPTKIAATSLLFCLVPLLLTADGASKAEVGRVQMMYFVAFVLVSPLAAGLSDRWQARRGFIALGGLGTLVACLPLLLSGAWWAAPLGIGLFGLFQALVGAPQLTLVSQIAREDGLPETAAIGWYRMIERLGAALGPVIALWAAVVWSYREATLAVGLLCAACAVLFWLADRAAPARRLSTPMAPAAMSQEA